MDKKYTTIRIKKETAKLLQGVGKKMETYDMIITRLVENAKN